MASNSDILATLNPIAQSVATDFLSAYPDAVLTSGKRDLLGQCSAMASNVAVNRRWIAETYVSSDASIAAQAWVDQNPTVTTVMAISSGLYSVLQPLTPDQLDHLSWHLAGDAFDAAPVQDPGQAACARELVGARILAGGAGKVLTNEGGIAKLHVQVC
jgi:hypothetical protein